MKQYIHLLGALTLWIIALIFLIFARDPLSLAGRLDRIYPYQLAKSPANRGDAFKGIDAIDWPESVCAATTNLASNATCKTARQLFSTNALKALECDKYQSPACACVNKALLALVSADGNSGKDLTSPDTKVLIKFTVKNCINMHHNSQISEQTKNTWIMRSSLLLLFTQMIFTNIFIHVVVHPILVAWKWHEQSWLRILTMIMSTIVPLILATIFEPNTIVFMCIIIFVPMPLLVWYEYIMPGSKSRPWVHPYVYGVCLSILAVLAQVENGNLNYDNLINEFLKAQATSYLYMSLVWFYMYMSKSGAKPNNNVLKSKSGQDAWLIITILGLVIWTNNFFAPYPTSYIATLLWVSPSVFTLVCFGGIVWVSSLKVEEPKQGSSYGESKDSGCCKVAVADQYISLVILFCATLVVMFYMELHSQTYRASLDNLPTASYVFDPVKQPWLMSPTPTW